ncbi:MAG: hypothetical protein KDD34_07790 [Bdellovibrionales bacterium]|nr:hypothetical protein [Bdellovibrionales bacterium]
MIIWSFLAEMWRTPAWLSAVTRKQRQREATAKYRILAPLFSLFKLKRFAVSPDYRGLNSSNLAGLLSFKN